ALFIKFLLFELLVGELGMSLGRQDLARLARRGYQIGGQISVGPFARVHHATRHGERCAVKWIDLAQTSDEYRFKFLPRELYIIRRLRHPNVITVYDIFSVDHRLVLVFMELADGGDLLDLVHQSRTPV